MNSRTPRKPRTASIVVCNLLTHRIIAGKKGVKEKMKMSSRKPRNASIAGRRRKAVAAQENQALLPDLVFFYLIEK
ncbi:MAG: hypothetical protein AMJ91_01210 [candidate division Zixibacteria bacterium SM23_73_3]|nr:MAG: hypothetical protein AMJ91_01210 [candidate division Zixibacteria bacterium SM23_73_3]